MNKNTLLVGFLLLGLNGVLVAQQHPSMPAGMTHEEHLAQLQKEAAMKKNGAAAMGFDQDTTRHHFLLFNDGGAIEVSAKHVEDAATIAEIRVHLKKIAADFSNGKFQAPLMTHGEMPAGAATMQQLRKHVRYQFESTAEGGRVRIKTSDSRALVAVQDFLRYQIREHATGDSLAIRP